jgi:hypothetical protein
VQHELAEAGVVSLMGARHLWHLSLLWLTQQFEVCELGTDTSAGAIGERAPTPNVRAANNSRAGSFIGYSLSPVGTFQRTFLLAIDWFGGIDFIKISLQRFQKIKNMMHIYFHSELGESHEN